MKWLVAIALIWLAWRYLKPAPKRRSVSRVAPLSGGERDALRMLDLPAGADESQIREAHRRRIAETHPDRGGSAELTRELNAARDLLLGAARRG
ncbi:MAG: J domain-containing protein [Sphingomonas taxi]